MADKLRRQNKYKIIVISLLATTTFLSCFYALAQETLRERIRERRLEKVKQKLSPPPYHPEKLQVFEFGGMKRTYLLHVPSCYKKGIPIPLVLDFHGGGGTGEAAEMQSGLSKKAEEACFIVIYPEGVSIIGDPGRFQYWNAGHLADPAVTPKVDDVGFVSALLDKLEQEYSIDQKRIYSTGISQGAWMSYRLACELSDKIAAIAPITGGIMIENCKPQHPVSIIHFHGTADPGWPYNGGNACFTKGYRPPAFEAVSKFIALNQCIAVPKTTYQNGEVTCNTYSSCAESSEIIFCTIQEGGHTWPGGYSFPVEQVLPWDKDCALGKGRGVGKVTQDISATDAMWEFFKRHSIKDGVTKNSYKPGDYDFSLVHDGLTRTYKVHVPARHDDTTPVPVVMYLHGGAGDKRAAYMDGMDKMSDKYGFILAIPEGTGEVKLGHLRGSWNGGKWATGACCGNADDVGFISKMIDEIKQKFNVDEKRIYATGISNGGLMTNRLGCELTDKIAAIATVAPAAVMSSCSPSRPMPVMDIQGTVDPANPPDGSQPRGIFKEGSGSGFAMSYKKMTPYQVVDAWKKINRCTEARADGYQNGGAKCIIYNECAEGAEVELCMVEGMGHAWPGGSQYLPASMVGPVSYDISFDQIWEFFKRHPRE